MKISGYILLGILVIGGFGVFGYIVGENFQKSASNDELGSEHIFEQSKTNSKDSLQHMLR